MADSQKLICGNDNSEVDSGTVKDGNMELFDEATISYKEVNLCQYSGPVCMRNEKPNLDGSARLLFVA